MVQGVDGYAYYTISNNMGYEGDLELAITAAPLANGYVKARTGDSTTDTVYTGWYTAVYLPEVTPDTSGTQQSGQQGTDDETGGQTL